MAQNGTNKAGFLVFVFLYFVILAISLSLQQWAVESVLFNVFPNFAIETDVLPGEWIIITNDVSSSHKENRSNTLQELFRSIRFNEYSSDKDINAAIGKTKLKEFAFANRQTLYFVNPFVAFMPMQIFFTGVLAFLLSMFIPGGSKLSWIRNNVMREYHRQEVLLRKQFKAHELEFDSVVRMEYDDRAKVIRNSTLPEVVIKEVEDFVAMHHWLEGDSYNPITPIKFYFRYHIADAYGNLIQGIVSGGAGVLIFIIGLRGLKLIPPEEPSVILMALSLEFVLLMVLMITFAGSAQEERLDRVVKELESEQRDAIKQQTNTLHDLLGQNGQEHRRTAESIAEYDERRMVDEILRQMMTELDRRKSRHGN